MSGSHIDDIKARISIEEIVGEQVDLSLAGKNLKGLCPFHNEKSPSFVVSPDRGTFYCFGCGMKGDIFSFIQETQGIDFKEALKVLADRASVVLDTFTPRDTEEEDARLNALEKATQFFEAQLLESKDAKDYIISRGISAETRNAFRIGYAPNDWHALHTYLEKKNIPFSILEEVGLSKKGEKGAYDHFRDRIMFPIFSEKGKVIAFSGRLLHKDDKSAKYVNSPETPVFHKSDVLFGLHAARPAMRKNNFVILVEGQVDLIMAHQIGFTNAVATSGTAFTEEHATLLKRYVDTVYIAYDGDMAGQKAAVRAWDILLNHGCSVKIVTLPGEKDPADVITESPEVWKKAVAGARPLIEYMTEKIYSVISDPHRRITTIEEKVLPKLRFITSSVEKSYFISYLAQKTGLSEELLWHHTGAIRNEPIKKENVNLQAFPIEKELRSIIAWQQSLPQDKRVISTDEMITKMKVLATDCGTTFIEDMHVTEEDIFLFEERYNDPQILTKHIDEMFKKYSRESIRQAIAELSNMIVGDNDSSHEILVRIHELTKKSKEISG